MGSRSIEGLTSLKGEPCVPSDAPTTLSGGGDQVKSRVYAGWYKDIEGRESMEEDAPL